MEAQKRIGDFFSHCPLNKYSKSDVIVEGDRVLCQVHFLTKGLVSEYCLSPSGGMFTLHIYHPGSFFPICIFCGEEPTNFTMEAFTDVETRSCPVNTFMEFITSDKDLLYSFASGMSVNLSAMAKRLGIIANGTAYGRAVSALLFLGERFGKKVGGNGAVVIEHPFSHKEIASWMGTARETASINLKKLEREGLIKYRRHRILIPDFSLLCTKIEN